MNSPTIHERSCFNSSVRPTLNPEIVNHTDVNVDIDTNLPENSAPMMNSDLIFVDWEDTIRREVLRNRLMGYRSSSEINDQLLSPGDANLSDAGIFLDQVRSEGLRQWNMAMDVEYHYEIFNRLPVYYGGDLYDTEDTDEFDPDDASCMEDFDATGDNSDTDSVAELEYNTWNDSCVWEFWSASGNIPPGLIQNPPMELIRNGLHQQKDLLCMIVTFMEDFDATGDNSDTDSIAEHLE